MKEVWSFRFYTWRCVQYRVEWKIYLTENHLHRPLDCSCFILHMVPRVSHTNFMFRYVFQIYAVSEVICLNVVNYSVRF